MVGVPSPVDASAAEAALRAARLADPATFESLERVRSSPAATAVARRILEAGESGDVRWVAAWVYSTAGEDPAPLVPLLADGDVSLRVIGAAGLLERGDARGFEPLIEALGHAETMTGTAPPRTVWAASTAVLVRMTGNADLGPPFDGHERVVKAAQARWQTWLSENRARLRFDPEAGEWRVQ